MAFMNLMYLSQSPCAQSKFLSLWNQWCEPPLLYTIDMNIKPFYDHPIALHTKDLDALFYGLI
jgi:hypothetical protein